MGIIQWIDINERKPTRKEIRTEQIFVWVDIGNNEGLCWEADYDRSEDKWNQHGGNMVIRNSKITHWGLPDAPAK